MLFKGTGEPIVNLGVKVKSVNHRGYNTIAPENTLSAFKLSKEKGFDIVECDISFTSDNIPVLLHDDTIDRTSNGTGNIADLTFEQVRAYDFGSWKNAKYTGELIPSLDEFVALCRNIGLHPYIEIKSAITNEQAQIIIDVVKRNGMAGNVTYISFNGDSLTAIKNIDPEARLGLVCYGVPGYTETANSLKTGQNEVFLDGYVDTIISTAETAINHCVANDLPLEVWTANTENSIINLPTYVTGVTSDNLIASEVLYSATI